MVGCGERNPKKHNFYDKEKENVAKAEGGSSFPGHQLWGSGPLLLLNGHLHQLAYFI